MTGEVDLVFAAEHALGTESLKVLGHYGTVRAEPAWEWP